MSKLIAKSERKPVLALVQSSTCNLSSVSKRFHEMEKTRKQEQKK
ncbi:hypothetical protein [Vibrio penaeicida]|nr:hypothetical protein [Vibrio penaeicida]